MATVQGRLRVKIKTAYQSTFLNVVPGVYVKSSNSATCTAYNGEYIISDVPGHHTLQFLDQKSNLILTSALVDFVAGTTPTVLNVTIDLGKSTAEVKKFLAGYISKYVDDPDFIGWCEGYVRRKNKPRVKIAGAHVTTNCCANVTSADNGFYRFSEVPGNYIMTVTHDCYQDWTGNITVVDSVTVTQTVDMTPKPGC
jgi:hypothetical protein